MIMMIMVMMVMVMVMVMVIVVFRIFILEKKCDFVDYVFSIVSIVKLWSGNWATAVLFNEYKVAPLVACCPPC